MRVLALADDLTGALEAGVKFAALVSAWPGHSRLQSSLPYHVIDTESRHLPAHEAAARIVAIASACQADLIYKKTDSTLRGNIGAELGALLAICLDSPVIYAPAYPRMGRTVRDGHLHVHGAPAHQSSFANDALNPVSDSSIARVLRSQTPAPIFSGSVAEMGNLVPGAIYVCDGESEADLANAARLVAATRCRLAAGPAAFAEAIAGQMKLPHRPPAPWPRIRSCLAINGSRHELSSRQVCHAVERGWRVAGPGAIPESQWVILDRAAEGSALEVAQKVGATVSEILERVKLEALIVFGGDTAYAIVQAIGNPSLRPLAELVPGVPLSQVDGRQLHLVTKAGGFGSVDVLSAIQAALT